MSVHYTAVIIVERVDEEQPSEYDQYDKLRKQAVPRKASEVAKITVRSASLPGVTAKVKSHVDLIDIDEV